MIRFNNVCKTYTTKQGEFQAVKNVDLIIEENTIHGIIGPSGAGKSTLIRLINQLEVHEQGEISVFDYKDIRKLNKESTRMYRRDVSMMFQRFNVLERKTVLENILLPVKFHQTISSDDRKKAKELLSLVGLEGYESSYPTHLSGGQLQRVGIARALITNPKILLCDEPTSALDTQTIKSFLTLLKRIKLVLNLTVVIVTHDMNVIKEICDDVTVMHKGEIIESNSLDNIIFNPTQDITKVLLDSVGFNLDQLIKTNFDKNLFVLRFSKRSSNEDVLSMISKKMSLSFNILYANITPHKEGIMLLHIDEENLDYNTLKTELKNLEVGVKHVS